MVVNDARTARLARLEAMWRWDRVTFEVVKDVAEGVFLGVAAMAACMRREMEWAYSPVDADEIPWKVMTYLGELGFECLSLGTEKRIRIRW